jgi:hypothetical protein
MNPHYRHTQVGWVTLGSIGGGVVLMAVLLAGIRELAGVSLVALPMLLIGLLFATLTVEVDARELRVSFTFGVVRRRVPLSGLRRCTVVTNPWYYGWGIHKLRGGWIWNVSGFDAVELVLADDSLWRVGTDEPDALVRVLEAATPHHASPADRPRSAARARGGLGNAGIVVGGLLLALLASIGLTFYYQTRDPEVHLEAQRLSVSTPFYGQDYSLSEVTAVSLEPRLPRVLARTNGFSGAGLLRGWFLVEGLGKGKLFVDTGNGPYLLVRLRDGFVILGFSDPAKTRALYEQLCAARPNP